MLRAMAFASTKAASLFDMITWRIYIYYYFSESRIDFLIDAFRALAVIHMPNWFPGARFKRSAREWYRVVDSAIQAPYDKVKGELVSSSGLPPRSLFRSQFAHAFHSGFRYGRSVSHRENDFRP